MPKYRMYVSFTQYRSFDFEADNEDLAWDHAEQLLEGSYPPSVLLKWEESGPEELQVEEVCELRGANV